MAVAAQARRQVVIWEPQPRQSAFITCPADDVGFGGARGGGKGQPLTGLVLTPFGFRSIGCLRVGSPLCAPDGSVTEVIAVHELGERQLYRVSFHDGTSCEVTGDHIWLAWQSNKGRKRNGEKRSGEISARLWLTEKMASMVGGRCRFTIPITQPVTFTDTARGPRRPVDPYALGALLGDGSLCEDYLRLTVADDYIANAVAAGLGQIPLGPYAYNGKVAKEYRWQTKSAAGEYLRRVGLIGRKSHDKFIPPAYLLGTAFERWELLRGLMDTDGWSDKDGDIYYCTISPRLRDDVAALARSLGALVTIRQKDAKDQNGNGSVAYTLRLKFRDSQQAFHLERKRALCGRKPQSMGRVVVGIEPTRVAAARCITVSHPSGLYLANDYIVTHNSDAVIGDWISHEHTYGEHAIGMAIRRERTQLVELIERSKSVMQPLGYKWHEQDKVMRGPKGGRLRFSYLEHDSDADAYQGWSLSRIYVEEAGTFPSEAPINKLQATLRSGQGVPCQIKMTCNPGGPGHQWVKARYRLDTHPNGFEVFEYDFTNPFTKAKIVKRRVFIPSKVTDNKFLGDDYVANLYQVGNEALVRAWLNGDWSVVEGAFFDCWDASKHVIRPFDIPADWLRFRSCDWGSARPFSVGWWAVVGDEVAVPGGGLDSRGGISLPRGAIVRYREWYGASSPNVGLKLTAEEVARGILSREDPGEKITYGVIDPAAFAVDGGPSIAERMAKEGVSFRRADNKRVSQRGAMGGWDMMRARLQGEHDRPMLYVFSTCRDLIRTLPAIQHDTARPEDVDTDGEDHALDESRYAVMSRPWVPNQPKPFRRTDELIYEAQPDGRIVANKSIMAIVEEKRRKRERGE
jgi:hypothetical protein